MMNIIAFTGAGVSKDSGIKTFQEQEGIRKYLTRQYANTHPDEYIALITRFYYAVQKAEPNDAHRVLAEYNIPIITMNIDGLHQKAGSKDVLEIHGTLPTEEELPLCNTLKGKPVLYGDAAPLYSVASDKISSMNAGDLLLVIGVSGYTRVASDLMLCGRWSGLHCVTINKDASVLVRKFLSVFNTCDSFTENVPKLLPLLDDGLEINF